MLQSSCRSGGAPHFVFNSSARSAMTPMSHGLHRSRSLSVRSPTVVWQWSSIVRITQRRQSIAGARSSIANRVAFEVAPVVAFVCVFPLFFFFVGEAFAAMVVLPQRRDGQRCEFPSLS